MATYRHNSHPKDFVRTKWIEFAKDIYDGAAHDFGIITFPAEAMQDLRLFREEGFIEWEEVETESADGTPNYRVTRGNVRCFEQKPSIYKILNQKLIEAKVNQENFCNYVIDKYPQIMSGKDKTFPVDVINLDFESRLHATSNRYPFDITLKCIFEFQKKHKRNFSLFLTWPVVEEQDVAEYKQLLQDIIESNLADPSAANFKTSFEEKIGGIENLEYENKSVIGVTKLVIKKASQNLFTLRKNAFYVYGGGERQRMISLLFNFKFDGKAGRENIIYSNDVVHSLTGVTDISHLRRN